MNLNKIILTVPKTNITVLHILKFSLVISVPLCVIWAINSYIMEQKFQKFAQYSFNELPIDSALDGILIASQKNTQHLGFEKAVDEANRRAIQYISTRLKLDEHEAQQFLKTYFQERNRVIQGVNTLMLSSKSVPKSELEKDIVMSYQNINAVNDYAQSMSGLLCNSVHFAIHGTIDRYAGKLASKLSSGLTIPCTELLQSSFIPFAQYLKDKAIIRDVDTITIKTRDKLKKSIVELATAEEIRTLNLNLVRTESFTFFNKFHLFDTHRQVSADIEYTTKIGFNLNDSNFRIVLDHSRRKLNIHLPEPVILSQSPNKIWFHSEQKSIVLSPDEKGMHNDIIQKSQKNMREADFSSVNKQAKQTAQAIILDIFTPIFSSNQFGYQVVVSFGNENQIRPLTEDNKNEEYSKNKELSSNKSNLDKNVDSTNNESNLEKLSKKEINSAEINMKQARSKMKSSWDSLRKNIIREYDSGYSKKVLKKLAREQKIWIKDKGNNCKKIKNRNSKEYLLSVQCHTEKFLERAEYFNQYPYKELDNLEN